MKFLPVLLLSTLTMVFASTANAKECLINSIKDDELNELIQERAWGLDKYDEICEKLARHNVGVQIDQWNLFLNIRQLFPQ